MITVSLCMIVKNEEKVLARCLDSIKDLVDEINIIDTGSTDDTKKIAARYTDRIFDFEWVDDFAAARNYSFSKATKEYTFWLDADDVIVPEDQERFHHLKETLDPELDSLKMPYILAKGYDGRTTSSLKRNRLVKTAKNFKWIGLVHEYLEVYGDVASCDVSVTHASIKTFKTDRNIKIYEKQLKAGKPFSPRDLYYYANECYEHKQYEKAITYYREFLDTKEGWLEDCIGAFDKGAESLLSLGKTEEAERFLYESFLYDLPRGNLCYKLGYLYYKKKEYDRAIYWYKAAVDTDFDKVQDTGTIVNHAYYTWLPHLQLCICYDAIGKYEQAYFHNEMARLYEPENQSILHNKKYLEKRLHLEG
ncbi:MAG: glycosyltransferase [Bacillus sp. (in: firmicutes)]